jgi:hypothetical protein
LLAPVQKRREASEDAFDQAKYPLVNQHNYGKSPFLMGKMTINADFP